MKAKIGILSLGCPRNIVDSENILGRLNLKGHEIVDINQAEIAIINTCSFIEEAKKESIDAILDLVALKKEGKLRKIIVYGCLSERYREELSKELPEVDAFVGKISLSQQGKRYSITPKHYAYLKICESCVNRCTFCIIPEIKGKFVSLGLEDILAEVARLNKKKISELNVIGQDITGYGVDLYGASKLEDAIKKISAASPDIDWIRLLYLYPSRISDELLKIIRDDPKICKYLDVPIQHINDRILGLMNRKSTKADILKLIKNIRKVIPGVFLRSAVIVGFPSETDKEFKELLDFIEEAKFERLGAFIYSREEGTPAHDLKGQIPQKVKDERFNAVMSLQQKISIGVNERFLGKTMDVLIDEFENGQYLGRSQFDAPEVDGGVFVNSKNALHPGDIVKVKITGTFEYDLSGEAIR